MLPNVSTDCETRKRPFVESVFGSTTLGVASLTLWRKVGTRVVPQRGTRSTFVGMAKVRSRRLRSAKATGVANILNEGMN